MANPRSVVEVKALLQEAKDWGTWKWLAEKRRVRQRADAAWADLEEVERELKGSWPDDLRKAYRELQGLDSKANGVDPQVRSLARRLQKEDDEALKARTAAEETFDEAERRLSTSLAQQGSIQAIAAYELREKFLERARAAVRK